MTTTRGLLDRNAAAEYLSIGLTTLRKLVSDKEIRVLKVGSATRYSTRDLDAYIERLRRAS